MILQQALKFIGPIPSSQILINFLLLSKDTHQILEKQILK